MSRPDSAATWSEDAVLGGRARLAQARRGYRFTADALWLVRFCRELATGHVVDLGAGCGVIGLCLATHPRVTGVVLVERQPDLAACARRSVELSAPRCPVNVLEQDLRELSPGAIARPAALVACNPPFFDPARSRPARSAEIDQARRAHHGDVGDFAAAARRLLAPDGWFAAVFPAPQHATLEQALARAGLTPRRVQRVRPRPAAPPRLVLVAAQAGGVGPGHEAEPWDEQDADGAESALARELRSPALLDP